MMLKNCTYLLISFLLISCQRQSDNLFLSNLNASGDSPIYTTYAAHMERSEFTLDEGYELIFNDPKRGIEFTTDTGGDICLGFEFEDKWVQIIDDFHIKPIITKSYPDLVEMHFYPVEDIKVNLFFLVKSSSHALLKMDVLNESNKLANFSIIPFIKNEKRGISTAALTDGAVIFTHEEYPDAWTLGHEVPYTDSIMNIALFSDNEAVSFTFNSYQGESPQLPYAVFSEKDPEFQLSGRSKLPNGERNLSGINQSRIQVYLDDNKNDILTERSPVFKDLQGSINGNGYFRVELGNLPVNDNSTYTFTFYLEPENLAARYTDSISNFNSLKTKRRDVTLAVYKLPSVPINSRIKVEGNEALISWDEQPFPVNVYRRDYPAGTYQLIAEKVTESRILDNVPGESIFGYILASVDPITGEMGIHSPELSTLKQFTFQEAISDTSKNWVSQWVKGLGFRHQIILQPGELKEMRMVRGAAPLKGNEEELKVQAEILLTEGLDNYVRVNEELYQNISEPGFTNPDERMLYWSSMNMMRQVFYPPEGKSSYNYYVFSREPTWGWGHGGQVFHESITMLAYAHLDPISAMNSQRVYAERQYDNGYINYRTGAYLDEIIEYKDTLTSSAPWYCWQNWEIYKITRDRAFLDEMYQSGKKFYQFYTSNRDFDGDGLCEWGGHAVLESVRDAAVAVWDEVGWPSNFDGVDVNSLLVMEAKALESMATDLGFLQEAALWKQDHEARTKLINQYMWDEETGFYYNVDRKDNDFTYKAESDLKRQEIIGFLPLWAGIASQEQAQKLVDHLTDPEKFWRLYGVPTLAADDPYYNDKGYWNGPVWVEWNFLVMQGLLNYGYKEEAKQLVQNVAQGMILQLKQNHNLWEFYSPDNVWAGYHRTYIWAGIINRMLMDVYK